MKHIYRQANTQALLQNHDLFSSLLLHFLQLNKKSSLKSIIVGITSRWQICKNKLDIRSTLSFTSISLIFKSDKGSNQKQTLFNRFANNNPAPCLHSSTLTTYSFDTLLKKIRQLSSTFVKISLTFHVVNPLCFSFN